MKLIHWEIIAKHKKVWSLILIGYSDWTLTFCSRLITKLSSFFIFFLSQFSTLWNFTKIEVNYCFISFKVMTLWEWRSYQTKDQHYWYTIMGPCLWICITYYLDYCFAKREGWGMWQLHFCFIYQVLCCYGLLGWNNI